MKNTNNLFMYTYTKYNSFVVFLQENDEYFMGNNISIVF